MTTPATPAVPSSMRCRPWSPTAPCSKVYAWYDNEMGYACRMVDLACHMEAVGSDTARRPQLRHRHRRLQGFTLTDGALRMLVLLHFYRLGCSPVHAGLPVPALRGRRRGGQPDRRLAGDALRHPRMLTVGLATQIAGFTLLSMLQPGGRPPVGGLVVAAQGYAASPKDLTKTASKSAIKVTAAAAQERASSSGGSPGSPAARTR